MKKFIMVLVLFIIFFLAPLMALHAVNFYGGTKVFPISDIAGPLFVVALLLSLASLKVGSLLKKRKQKKAAKKGAKTAEG